MTTLDAAIAYAIDAIRSGRTVTEATILAEFPALSSYGAEAARRAAEDATGPSLPARGPMRSNGTTFCTTDRAMAQRKLAEQMDRAAAAIPRTRLQGGKRR